MDVETCTCGTGLTNVLSVLSHAADGALPDGSANLTNFDDTLLTIASKDVVLVVPHGLCGVNGATTTIIK